MDDQNQMDNQEAVNEETTAAPMTDMPVEEGAAEAAPEAETAEDASQPEEEAAA